MSCCTTISILALLVSCQKSPLPVSIIPQPLSVELGSGRFSINENTHIETDIDNPELLQIGEYLKEKLAQSGVDLKISATSNRKNVIRLEVTEQPDTLGTEGYFLKVNKDAVYLLANTPAGLFHGIQTIRQLLPPEVEKQNGGSKLILAMPEVTIIDKPRFKWRGLQLDCCRHFMSKDFIKRYIDLLVQVNITYSPHH